MQQYKRDFIEFMVRSDVLTFGDFTTKSGRQTPFFINTGRYRTGEQLAQLGEFYAAAIDESWPDDVDILFGPAYKGIPLVASTATAMFCDHGIDLPFAFNRKEAKTHGEGGNIVGARLDGDVVVVDDVMTAGTAIKESMAILNDAGARGVGALIGLDRCERGEGELSAVQQVEEDWGLCVTSVISLHDIIEWVQNASNMSAHLEALERYRERYGVA